jgi:hypothetical protein
MVQIWTSSRSCWSCRRRERDRGEFVTRWLKDSAKGDLAPRKYHNYRLQVRRHIVPSLGRIRIENLTPVHVQALYAAKLRGG